MTLCETAETIPAGAENWGGKSFSKFGIMMWLRLVVVTLGGL
jgi:hypothetical protein